METKLYVSIAITILFVFYFLYETIKDKSKEKREKQEKNETREFYKQIGEQLLENALINKEILKYLKISSQKYVEEITESQVRIVIDSILSNSQFEVFGYLSKVAEENHIKGNEKEVTSKIKLFICNRLHKDFLMLKEFKHKENSLSDYSINEWKEYLIESVINNILKEKGQKTIQGILQNSYDSLKYNILDKTLNS